MAELLMKKGCTLFFRDQDFELKFYNNLFMYILSYAHTSMKKMHSHKIIYRQTFKEVPCRFVARPHAG